MIVYSNRQNFFCFVLVDDIFIKVFFDVMGFVMGDDFIQFNGEVLFFRLFLFGIYFRDKVINFSNARITNLKTCLWVKNRHVILIFDRNGLFAKTALMFDRISGRSCIFSHVCIHPFVVGAFI